MKQSVYLRLAACVATFLIFAVLSTTNLAITGCNGDGTNPGQSVDPGDGSDFSGDYVLRTDDCEPFVEIIEFTVEQNGDQLTIIVTKVEGGTYMVGDELDGMVVESEGNFIASIPELQCLAKLVLTQDEIDEISDLFGLDAEIGDLDAFCNDDSEDFFCTAIYQRS